MTQFISVILENESMQSYLEGCEDEILGAAAVYHTFPQDIKNHVLENLEDFIGENLEETFENIAIFTETAANCLISNMVESIIA